MYRLAPPPPDMKTLGIGPVKTPAHRPPPTIGGPKIAKVVPAEVLATRLLEGLLARVITGADAGVPQKPPRLPSTERGVSVYFLRSLCRFYQKHGGVSMDLGDVCGGVRAQRKSANVVTIGQLSGNGLLSLVECLQRSAQAQGLDSSALFGRCTTYVSHASEGTSLADVGTACQRALRKMQAQDRRFGGGRPRFLWLDALACPQSTVASDAAHASPEWSQAAHTLADSALGVCHEMILYLSPLLEEWRPHESHPKLFNKHARTGSAARQRKGSTSGGHGGGRVGPRALSRAWVLSELSTMLSRHRHRLRMLIEIKPKDVQLLQSLLEQGTSGVAGLISMVEHAVDVRACQLHPSADSKEWVVERLLQAVQMAASAPAATTFSTSSIASHSTITIPAVGTPRGEAIKLEGGVTWSEEAADACNELMRSRLRLWLIENAREAVRNAQMGGGLPSVGLIDSLVGLLRADGPEPGTQHHLYHHHAEEVRRLYGDALIAREKELGEEEHGVKRLRARVRVCEALKVVEEGAREQGELRRIETESR